jgi:hypothetical protein
MNGAVANDMELIGERVRRLPHVGTFDRLRRLLVEPECIEVNRVVMPASCAAAEADKMRALGKLVSIEEAETLGGGVARAYVVEHRRLAPLVQCVYERLLFGAIEEAFRQMHYLGDCPIRRIAAGRALLAKHVSSLIDGTPSDNEPEDLDDPGAVPPRDGLAAFIDELQEAN